VILIQFHNHSNAESVKNSVEETQIKPKPNTADQDPSLGAALSVALTLEAPVASASMNDDQAALVASGKTKVDRVTPGP